MKKLLLLFVLLTSFSQAQTAGCNQSSFSPITICYPSQTKNIAASMQTDMIYLCGTNSVVWDTLNPPSIKYRQVFVNTGGVYNYKSTITNNQITIYAKAGSTVNVLPGTNLANMFSITKETGTVFNNFGTGTITSNSTCSVITGPSINCSVTSVATISQNGTSTNVWPNPAHDKLFVSSENGKDKTINIINMLGEVIYSQKGIKEQGQEISLEAFHSGIYYVIIRSETITETKKIIITR